MADLWPAIKGWVQACKDEGITASDVIASLGLHLITADKSEEVQWALAAAAASQYRARSQQSRARLASMTSLQDLLELIPRCKRIVIIAGAGASSRASNADSTAPLFDPSHFVHNPHPFFAYVRNLLPGTLSPTSSHLFVRELEQRGKLQRAYSQNIDGLERQAHIERAIPCYGTLTTATCLACRTSVPSDAIRDDVVAGRVPRCFVCSHELNLLKPDVTFFGEQRGDEFEKALQEDVASADLLLVLGSDAAAEPVCSLPYCLPRSVPQVLVSPCTSELANHAWDLELIGPCDLIVRYLAKELDWQLGDSDGSTPGQTKLSEPWRSQPHRCIFVTETDMAANGVVKSGSSTTSQLVGDLPPAQTALALPQIVGHRGQKRGVGGALVGATLAGSGVGARPMLAETAPIEKPPPGEKCPKPSLTKFASIQGNN